MKVQQFLLEEKLEAFEYSEFLEENQKRKNNYEFGKRTPAKILEPQKITKTNQSLVYSKKVASNVKEKEDSNDKRKRDLSKIDELVESMTSVYFQEKVSTPKKLLKPIENSPKKSKSCEKETEKVKIDIRGIVVNK